jgi:phosphatidylinositol alpha-1,6-mannosyltransferase
VIVLFISRKFPPSVGGMERYAYELSQALEKDDVKLIKITWGRSNRWLPVVLIGFFFRATYELIRHPEIKVIHAQDAVLAPLGWLLHIMFKKPYIVVVHGLDITFSKFGYQKLILPFVRRANRVAPISSATATEVTKRGVLPSSVVVTTLGINDDYDGTIEPDKKVLSDQIGYDVTNSFLLLTTGRLVKRKGVAWFTENVMPDLVKTELNVKYLVVGSGAETELIQQKIKDMNLEDNVIMLGRVSDNVRMLLYQSCDVFVMPNIVIPGDIEGFGIVAQEAAVAGLPVVASNIEGIKDALQHQKNGILVKSGDKTAFKLEIERFIKDETYRKNFGQKARSYTLAESSWQKTAAKFEKIYADL